MRRDDEQLPEGNHYTTPDIGSADPTSRVDEANFDTLHSVMIRLQGAIAGLYKDFNAFTVLKDEDPEVATRRMLVSIEARQEAYDIVYPVYEQIRDSLALIDNKYKEM